MQSSKLQPFPVSPVQIALRIKKPLWKSGAHSCRNLSCVRRRFNRKKQTGRHQTRPFISESKLRRKKAFRPPFGQGPAYGFMEQEDLEACKAELSISTASQNTPTAIRPKTQAPATERMFIASFRRSASSQHRRTSARSAPQTEPGQMPHFSSREGCLLGYRSDLIITGCGNGSGCITERSKGMYFIAPF
ncbi:hypothetical protein CXT95_10655 [Akkermansia muciniphila]|uniref:Uncharacterized protein n=1 Tax=Akkermansia muciniphila TaxID=239935 RepID=A0AAX0WIK8_9BACT|nr:hypothetical protein CXT95_10655 [Akkermansia muciniphila]